MPARLPHTRYTILDTRYFLFRYLRIWRRAAVLNFTILVSSRIDFWTFIPSKLIRMGLFFVFALSLFRPGTTIVGYSSGEALLFFAVMNIIDVMLQIFYRGLTDHPRIVKNGDFDFILTKPISPLLWSTFRIVDLLDIITAPAAFALFFYALKQANVIITVQTGILTFFLFFLSFILSLSMNIAIASLAFWTTETEHVWRTYREVTYAARFPTEIFPSLARTIFTYFIPIFVIVSFPTKALLHHLSPLEIIWAFLITIITVIAALTIWNKGIKHYTSASS